MRLAMRKLWVYVRLLSMAAILVFGLLLVWENRRHAVTVWCGREFAGVSILWVMFFAGLAAVAGTSVWRSAIAVLREFRDLRRHDEERRRKKQELGIARTLKEQETSGQNVLAEKPKLIRRDEDRAFPSSDSRL